LLGEVASLCKEAIRFFRTHEKWKYQFLPAFEFNKSRGLEAYDKLFGPILAEPIENFLKESGCVPTWDGGWAKPDETICLAESLRASNDLIRIGILREDEIATIAGGTSDLKLVHPDVKERYAHPFKKVDRQDLLGNDRFLEDKSRQPNAPAWFRALYLWLAKNPVHYQSGRSHSVRGYHEFKFVLTSERSVLNGSEVWLPDVSPTDPAVKGLADTLQKSRNILHPDILAGAKDEEEAKILRGFLTSCVGVQVLDGRTVLKLSFGQEIGMKAVGYIRVSTEEQAREGISLENQRTKIQAYCSLNDLDLIEILEDAGRSGKDLNRDGIRRVIDLVRGREIDAVIVYKLDRLSRRVKDTLTILDAVDKKNIAFHSIMEKIDTKSAMGRFFLNIMASMSQWERDTIGERTRDALRLKILKNERAGQIPYGWKLAEDGKTLVENSLEQRAISLVVKLSAKGYSLRAICRELDKEGYKPIGKRWHPKTVSSILKKAA
jgi:DNA invertase Pin-like site-specific DNA recombinase